jgi:hypothetical protein
MGVVGLTIGGELEKTVVAAERARRPLRGRRAQDLTRVETHTIL